MDGSSCNNFDFVEVISLPGDNSLLLLLVQLEGFYLSLGWKLLHALSLYPVSGLPQFNGRRFSVSLCCVSLQHLISTTRGHELSVLFLTRPYLHLSIVVVGRRT
jgi:hypothetical protein